MIIRRARKRCLFPFDVSKLQFKCHCENIFGRLDMRPLGLGGNRASWNWRMPQPSGFWRWRLARAIVPGWGGGAVEGVVCALIIWQGQLKRTSLKTQAIWKVPVLVSCYYCNKFHQLHGIKQHKFILLRVLQVRRLKWVCRATFILEL